MVQRWKSGLWKVTAVVLPCAIAVLSCVPSLLAEGDTKAQAAADAKFNPEQVKFYEEQVKPVLQAHCIKCHGGEAKIKGGLRLTSRAEVLKGGDTGPAASPDAPDKSLLLKAVRYEDEDLQMPPKQKLPQDKIDVLAKWVQMGLPWSPGDAAPVAAPGAHSAGGIPVTPEAKTFWSFQPVKRPPVPQVKKADWVRTPVDAFILAKLEEKGMSPAPAAEKGALLRRAYYDLTGLPPTPAEVDAFVADSSAGAYEKVIEKLLASPHYGEKWGRHWLDLVRYAETNGYERDGTKPYVWRFRDYVIKSFNEDKPYDQFLREQLAGDEFAKPTRDSIIATGYYRLGLWDDEPADPLQAKFDEYDDIVSTTAQVTLGLTVGCARCHNHKIDPIPQADYYKLLAFFADIRRYSDSRDVKSANNLTDIGPAERKAEYEQELEKREKRKQEIVARMQAIEDAAIRKMSAEDQRASEGPDREQVVRRKLRDFTSDEEWSEHQKLRREHRELAKFDDPRELALSVSNCLVKPAPTHVLVRGSPHSPGDEVKPGFPEVLGFPEPAIPQPKPGARSSGRRTILAEWIASPSNPLTARVMVNRIWQHHFGRGIVRSTSDFGTAGDRPTHPELLDWLASEFIAKGWRLKDMHRLIMTSSAYRMSSRYDEAALAKDPNNDLFWHFDPRRLTAEEIRDSILAVNGTLNLKMAGPSIYTEVPKEVLATSSQPHNAWGTSPPEERTRRSVYVFIKRSLLEPVLNTFDQADTDNTCPVRFSTTVPTQSLTMLNSAFMQNNAAALAARLRKEAGKEPAEQARLALRLALCRKASEDEVQRGLELMKDLQSQHAMTPEKALDAYCLMVLNLNEFVYLD